MYLQKIFSKYTTADEWVGGQQIEYCYWCDEEKKHLKIIKDTCSLVFSKRVYKAEKKIVSPYW